MQGVGSEDFQDIWLGLMIKLYFYNQPSRF